MLLTKDDQEESIFITGSSSLMAVTKSSSDHLKEKKNLIWRLSKIVLQLFYYKRKRVMV